MEKKVPGVIGVLFESRLSTTFKWEIPNFSSLSFSGLNNCYVSDVFSFESIHYRLCVYGARLRSNCHSVYLSNEKGISSNVNCSLSILKTDGTHFVTETASVTSSHWFKNFIKKSLLQQNESELLPAGTLTVVCVLTRGLRLNRRGVQIANSFNKRQRAEDLILKINAAIARSDDIPPSKKIRRTSTPDLIDLTAGDVSGAAPQSTYFSGFERPPSSSRTAAYTSTGTFLASRDKSTTYKMYSNSTVGLSTRYKGSTYSAFARETAFGAYRRPWSKYGTTLSTSSRKFRVKAYTSASAHISSEKKVLRDYRELFLKQKYCDVILKVQEQKFPAHKAILRARSTLLESTSLNDKKEKTPGIISIDDCDSTCFSDFLCFLYSGDTDNITKTNVFSLFKKAVKYNVRDLRKACMKIMKRNLSVDTICETIPLAMQFPDSELSNLAIGFFCKNLQKIIVTSKWKSLLSKNPSLSNDLLIKALVTGRNSNN